MIKIVLAVLLTIAVLALAAGYVMYRYIIVRRRAGPEPGPQTAEKAPNELRRRYALGYAEQMHWLRAWGFEEVYIQSRDGKRLAGYFFRAKTPTARTALAIHGYRSDGGFREYLYFAPMYLESLGMNLLLVDDYAHAQSEGKRIGFGWNDRWDCLAWCRWVVDRVGAESEILLQGVSMGAATVLMAAGEESLPAQVRWVVADCPYTSVEDEVKYLMSSRYHVPAFPLYHLASLWCRLLAGYSFGQASTLAQTQKITRPTLFIHGSEDLFVPTEMGVVLHDACRAPKELLVVEGAAHTESFMAAPQAYEAAVRRLLG